MCGGLHSIPHQLDVHGLGLGNTAHRIPMHWQASGLLWRAGAPTMKGFFLTPGFRKMAWSVPRVCLSTCSGQMSTLVTTKKTGTLSARATPMCSLHIPTTPAGSHKEWFALGRARLLNSGALPHQVLV